VILLKILPKLVKVRIYEPFVKSRLPAVIKADVW